MASAWTPSLVLTGGFWSGLFSVEVSPGMKGMSCPFVDGEYKAGMPRSPESPSADPCSSISFWRYAGPGKAEFGYTAPAQRRREELRCRRRRCCCWRWAGAAAVLYSLSKAFAPPAAAAIVFPASARQEQTGPAPAPLVSGAFPAVQTTGRQRTTLASGQKTCNQQGLRWLSFIFCLHLSSHLGFLLGENSAYLLP